jgi:LuxR family maltose regulon positive regulatory protein
MRSINGGMEAIRGESLEPALDPGAAAPKSPRERLAEATIQLADFRRRQGRLSEARRLLNQASEHPASRQVEAALALDRGDPAAAAELAERLLHGVTDQDERAAGLKVLALAAGARDDVTTAQRAADELRQIADDAGTDHLIASAAVVEGVIAFRSGELHGARARLGDAVDRALAAGDVYETAQARLWLSRTLTASDEVAAAEEEALAAVKLFGSVAARLGVRESWAALAAARGDPSGRSPLAVLNEPLHDFPLSAREIEVLKLVGDGLSNPQIAKRLVLSPHTVHRHVANIMSKLMVTSRTAAVGQAARRGLL